MLLVHLRRVSSGEQVSGTGLDRQTASAEVYAKARGWTLHPEVYSDEGVSGFSGANLEGDLGRLLSDLKRGHFGSKDVALGIEDLDRLSRQFSLAFLPVLVDDLLNQGVTISVMAKGRDFSRASIRANPMELHELLFWMGSAHEFSEKLSHRIGAHRDSIRDAIRGGEPTNPGAAPSWISLVDGQWEFNDYAATIRQVVEMAQQGDGSMVIAKAMNDALVPPPGAIKAQARKPRRAGSPPPKRQPATTWDKNSVTQILKSPALHGARKVAAPGHNEQLRLWKEECARLTRQGIQKDQLPERPKRQFEDEQAGYYPALITPAEHELLLDQMTRRRTSDAPGRKDQINWIGQRLTVCNCGAVMTATSSRAKSGKRLVTYKHLRCTGRRDGSTDCQAPLVRLEQAQAHLLTRIGRGDLMAILRIDAGSAQQKQLEAATTKRTEATAAVQALEQRHRAGEAALTESDDPAVMTVLAKRQATVEAELEAARQELRAADLAIEALALRPPIEQATAEAEQEVERLFATFAREEDGPEDRRAINAHLRKIGLQIVIDSEAQQIGLAIGEGEIDWQPLSARARAVALQEGMVNPQHVEELPDSGVHVAESKPKLTDQLTPEEAALLADESLWVDPEG